MRTSFIDRNYSFRGENSDKLRSLRQSVRAIHSDVQASVTQEGWIIPQREEKALHKEDNFTSTNGQPGLIIGRDVRGDT